MYVCRCISECYFSSISLSFIHSSHKILEPHCLKVQMSIKTIVKFETNEVKKSTALSFEIAVTNKAIKDLNKKISTLNQCKNISESTDKNFKLIELTAKWNSINKCCLNHLHNAYLIKYKGNEGYIKHLENQINVEKEKIRYRTSDNLEYEWENIQESAEYQMLDEWEKKNLKSSFEERIAKNEELLEFHLKKLDERIEDFKERGGEFDIEELCKNLKIDYNLIYQD